MPRQLTFSFTFMHVIWFRSLYLPRPIISDFSKFRRVPACLLKLCMSGSANFRLSSSFVNSIMSSAYCKVLNSILLSQSYNDLTFNPWIKFFCLSRIESISMATINKSALTGQPCFTERVNELFISVICSLWPKGSFIQCFTLKTLVFTRKTIDFTCKTIH